jgi:hypothetical protein
MLPFTPLDLLLLAAVVPVLGGLGLLLAWLIAPARTPAAPERPALRLAISRPIGRPDHGRRDLAAVAARAGGRGVERETQPLQ